MLLVWVLWLATLIGVFDYLSHVYGISAIELNFAELSEMDSTLLFALFASILSVSILILSNWKFHTQKLIYRTDRYNCSQD